MVQLDLEKYFRLPSIIKRKIDTKGYVRTYYINFNEMEKQKLLIYM